MMFYGRSHQRCTCYILARLHVEHVRKLMFDKRLPIPIRKKIAAIGNTMIARMNENTYPCITDEEQNTLHELTKDLPWSDRWPSMLTDKDITG